MFKIGFQGGAGREHPERGLVSAAEFVPLAEESGLIVAIGQRVLEDSRRRAQAGAVSRRRPGRWREPLRQAIPGSQARREGAAVLEVTGLDPYALLLEVTESAVMETPPREAPLP